MPPCGADAGGCCCGCLLLACTSEMRLDNLCSIHVGVAGTNSLFHSMILWHDLCKCFVIYSRLMVHCRLMGKASHITLQWVPPQQVAAGISLCSIKESW